MIDLTPAARRMRGLLSSITESQFGAATPCPEASVGDLVDHVGGLTLAFTAAARKDRLDHRGPPPPPSGANLEPSWRDRIAADLDALVEAWRDPGAWEGMTSAGGVDLPGEAAGLVALDELVVHGWDLAVATTQAYQPSEDEIEAAIAFIASFDAPRDGSLFGPIVPVPSTAPALDRLVGLTGRDPNWRPQG